MEVLFLLLAIVTILIIIMLKAVFDIRTNGNPHRRGMNRAEVT